MKEPINAKELKDWMEEQELLYASQNEIRLYVDLFKNYTIKKKYPHGWNVVYEFKSVYEAVDKFNEMI